MKKGFRNKLGKRNVSLSIVLNAKREVGMYKQLYAMMMALIEENKRINQYR